MDQPGQISEQVPVPPEQVTPFSYAPVDNDDNEAEAEAEEEEVKGVDVEPDNYFADESTPLVPMSSNPKEAEVDVKVESPSGCRFSLFLFLEAKTRAGLVYESFTILMILLSVLSFALSSLFLPEYNAIPSSISSKCGPVCDAIWFGNDPNNALKDLGIGATSILEIFIIGVFTIDYVLRLYTADLLDPKYRGFVGRLKFIPTFFSLVDLASTVPFYVDAFLLPNTDLAASNFLRMFRLLRMMRMEGLYDLALGLLDDVLYEQKGILGIGLFVGFTTWTVLASFFYVAERKNTDMIYCGAAPDRCFENQDDIDTRLCTFDEYGFVDCSAAGCASGEGGDEPCYNVYRSIFSASFWTLMELFGEFPLVDQHNLGGKVLGTFTAIVAVAVFALPAGILGSGFEDLLTRRREEKERELEDHNVAALEHGDMVPMGMTTFEDDWEVVEVVGDGHSLRGSLYNFFHAQTSFSARLFDHFINILVVGTALTFMFDTINSNVVTPQLHTFFDVFELVSVIIFAFEFLLRFYSAGEDPKYRGIKGRFAFATSFLSIVDILSFLPYLIDVYYTRQFITPYADKSISTTVVKFLRLLRLLRFEKYTKAFTTFDDVIRENLDVLSVTGFSALLMWILFSAILYYTERNNPDEDVANYYKSVPHAMWITLLNLSGECPLGHYSVWGKIMNGIIGLFATAIFGIPIGLLGAGFEEIVSNEYKDTPDEVFEDDNGIFRGTGHTYVARQYGIQVWCYRFVNGIGSGVAVAFEISIYVLIATTVTVGIIQTVEGQENTMHQLEWVSVVVFTFEYILRFIGAGVDPEFASIENRCCGGVWSRIKYVVSFYSIIDLLAILPFYLAIAFPESWFDRHDEYLRMFRLLRLLKLDKYVPSITLIDDVLRLKKKALIVSCYAGGTLWVLFAGLMYLAEYKDHSMGIDNLPFYGCTDDCTMSVRFSNYFKSLSYTGIHLTGDFPMVEYDGVGRIFCFFMIIAAIGVVSIPSGLIASGFAEIVQSKTKKRNNKYEIAGDDWYEIKYRELEGQKPPNSIFGTCMDSMQESVHAYLNGIEDKRAGTVTRSTFSRISRKFFFALIISNILAVMFESIPEVDRKVGNAPGNFFDVFELVSVIFFTIEYLLRLFSAPKSRTALFSSWVYATTFFGLVDFISIAPWYLQEAITASGHYISGDEAKIFRIFRIFRILQLEDFIIAFSKLDNVFRASKDVLKATGLMAIIIWVGSSALFYIFEQNNPNLRECNPTIPLVGNETGIPGCYDFVSTADCNSYYPGMCSQAIFTNMPNTMFYVAVFLGGDWGFIDFTWQGRLVCLFLCIAGIALYAIPVGTLFDSFGAVIGIGDDDEDDEEEDD